MVFVTNRQVEMGAIELPPSQPWVVPVSKQELLDEFKGWSDDVKGIIECLHNPSKWLIHALHPPLESYVNGKIALVGDSVRPSLCERLYLYP